MSHEETNEGFSSQLEAFKIASLDCCSHEWSSPPPIPFCMHLSRTVFPLIILHLDISSRLSVWAVVSYWSRKWEMVNCASIFILSGHGDKVPTFVKFKKTNKKPATKTWCWVGSTGCLFVILWLYWCKHVFQLRYLLRISQSFKLSEDNLTIRYFYC